MPLQRQTLSIPLLAGVDQKSDPLQIPLNKLLLLENAIFTSPKKLRKRFGYAGLTNAVSNPVGSSKSIVAGSALMAYLNELVMCDPGSIYSYDANAPGWNYKGELTSPSVTQQSIIRNTQQQSAQDGTHHPVGIQAYAWEDSSGGSYYSVIDTNTNQIVVPAKLLTASAIKPKVLSIGGQIVILYFDTNTGFLVLSSLTASNPNGGFVSTTNITAASGASGINTSAPNYDATVLNTLAGPQLYVAFNNASSSTTIFCFSQTNLTNAANVNVIAGSTYPSKVLTIFGDAKTHNGPVLVLWNGTVIEYFAYEASSGQPALPSPTLLSFVTQSTGGHLSNGNYGYVVTAVNAFGETLPSAEGLITLSGGTATQEIIVRWNPVPNAASYNVYGRTPSGELFIASNAIQNGNVGVQAYLDDGSIVPSGALPTANTTGSFGSIISSGVVDTISNIVSLTGVSTSAVTTALSIYYGVPNHLVTPSGVVATAATAAGGTLANATYYYRVSALGFTGETLAATEQSASTAGGQNAVLITWNPVRGAVGYNVYGRTMGAETLLATVNVPNTNNQTVQSVCQFTDLGTISPSGALPVANTSTFPSEYTLKRCVIGAGYAVGAANNYLRGVSPAGKAFAYPQPSTNITTSLTGSRIYIPLAKQSPLQSTYLLSDADNHIAARMLYSIGGGIPFPNVTAFANYGSAMLPETSMINSTTWLWPQLVQNQVITATNSNNARTMTGVVASTLNFLDPVNSYPRAQLAQNLHVGGGLLHTYDGISPVEHNFHFFPEHIDVALATSGGQLSAGTYSYVFWYEWPDGLGQTHRSEPSVPIEISVSAGYVPTFHVDTLRITEKQPFSGTLNVSRTPVSVMCARTTANGTNYYECINTPIPAGSSSGGSSATNAPVINNTSVQFVTFIDQNISDAQLIGNPLLYTTGGILSDNLPNSISNMTVFQNRIVAQVSDLQLVISKQVLAGFPGSIPLPVEFSRYMTPLSIDPRGGPVTALGVMDLYLLLFKETSIFQINGQGPDATGSNGTYSDATLITTDVGCSNPRSIVTVPNGVMFQSQKGIYLLGRDTSVTYVGADVEAFNGQQVTSAQLIPNTNQVRFTLAPGGNYPQGCALMYDYFVGLWSVHVPVLAADSALWQNETFVYLNPNGIAYQETPNLFADPNNNWIKLRMWTPWYALAELQGFARIWRMLILGQYVSPHRLIVQLAYDNLGNSNPAFTQYVPIQPQVALTFGSDPYFGASTPFGGMPQPYQFIIFPNQQSLESLAVSIEDGPMPGNTVPGEGCSWSGIEFEYGREPGTFRRLPTTNQFG